MFVGTDPESSGCRRYFRTIFSLFFKANCYAKRIAGVKGRVQNLVSCQTLSVIKESQCNIYFGCWHNIHPNLPMCIFFMLKHSVKLLHLTSLTSQVLHIFLKGLIDN